jgi:hypothetical protein
MAKHYGRGVKPDTLLRSDSGALSRYSRRFLLLVGLGAGLMALGAGLLVAWIGGAG